MKYLTSIVIAIIVSACSSGGGSSSGSSSSSTGGTVTEPSVSITLESVKVSRLESGEEQSVDGLPVEGAVIEVQ